MARRRIASFALGAAAVAAGAALARRRRLLALAARFMPPPSGDQHTRREGAESNTPLAPSLLTALDRIAKRRNNEE